MSGKRRNPFRVRITVGWVMEGQRVIQKFKTVGYYKTKQEALEALAEYEIKRYKFEIIAFEECSNRNS